MVNVNVFSSAKLFFSEWEDSKKNFSLFFLMTLFFIVSLIWVKTNIPTIAYQADIFLWLAVIGFIIGIVDYLKEDNDLVGFLFIGKDIKTTVIGFIVGCLFAGLLYVNKFAVISTPMSSVQISANLAAFIFVVLVAPFVEELFFRMSLYPTLVTSLEKKMGKFQAGILSILIVCSAFAFFHFAVFSAGITLMISAFLFSLISIIGNRVMESSYFSFGLHIANNFLAIGAFVALAGLI